MMGNFGLYFNFFFSVSSKLHCLFSKKRRKINILSDRYRRNKENIDETILP